MVGNPLANKRRLMQSARIYTYMYCMCRGKNKTKQKQPESKDSYISIPLGSSRCLTNISGGISTRSLEHYALSSSVCLSCGSFSSFFSVSLAALNERWMLPGPLRSLILPWANGQTLPLLALYSISPCAQTARSRESLKLHNWALKQPDQPNTFSYYTQLLAKAMGI